MKSCSVFYITAGDIQEAKKIANLLVGKKIAACVNIIPKMISFFYWEEEVQEEEEILVLGKTSTDQVEELVKSVKEVHSYDVPCIITWEISGGNQAFLDWIVTETQ